MRHHRVLSAFSCTCGAAAQGRTLLASLVFGFTLAVTVSESWAIDWFGWWPFDKKEETAQTAEEAPDDALPYVIDLVIADDDEADITKKLRNVSVLVAEQALPPSGVPGMIARALEDERRLVAAAYREGYYGAIVEIRFGNILLEEAVATQTLPSARPVPVLVRIKLGPKFVFGDVGIDIVDAPGWYGPTRFPAEDYGLVRGEIAYSNDILEAEERALEALRAAGYPKAQIADLQVIADHAKQQVDVSIVLSAGRSAVFGPLTVSGNQLTDPDFIRAQTLIQEGEAFSPEKVERAERRLADLGIFESARLVPADEIDRDGALAYTIEIRERKRYVIGAGLEFSTSEGFGGRAYWRRRNLFGRGEVFGIEGSFGRLGQEDVGDLEYALALSFTKPGVITPRTRFEARVGARQENPKSYKSQSVFVLATLVHEFGERNEASIGVSSTYLSETEAFGDDEYFFNSVPMEMILDARDDPADPKKGYRFGFSLEPAYEGRHRNTMLLTRAELAAYWPIDPQRRIVLAGRVAVGSITAPAVQDVPSARRYYLGGGGSIRGYAYRNVGPRLHGNVIGGRSFFEGSAELRARATETIGLVAFTDFGNAFEPIAPDFSEPLKIGLGLGARYITAVGPLRFDVAVPLDPGKDDPSIAVYIGIGQSF